MKRIFIILVFSILFGMIGGGLYNTLANLDAVDKEAIKYTLMNPFPDEMPDVFMDPATGYSLF